MKMNTTAKPSATTTTTTTTTANNSNTSGAPKSNAEFRKFLTKQ